jgi:hypothetical protein
VSVSLQAVKDEIAARAGTITGLRVYSESPPTPQPPAFAIVGPTRWSYHATMSDDMVWTFEGWIFVSPSDLMRAQQALDSYLWSSGAKSVPYVLENAEVTEGIIQSIKVIGGPRPFALTGDESSPRLLAAMLELEVVPFLDDD